MKRLFETIPDHIQRVCVAPKTSDTKTAPTRSFRYSVFFLVLAVAAVGLAVALAVTGYFDDYTDMLIRLSRGF